MDGKHGLAAIGIGLSVALTATWMTAQAPVPTPQATPGVPSPTVGQGPEVGVTPTPAAPGAEASQGQMSALERYYKPFKVSKAEAIPKGQDLIQPSEFMPGYLAGDSQWGKRWGIEPVTIADRKERERVYRERLDERMASTRAPRARSTELVIDVVDALLTGNPVELPMNIPNAGQCPDLPEGAVVESICVADTSGIRGRDEAVAPPALATHLRRIVTAQECTVEAAVNNSEDALLAALFSDPLAGALDHDALRALHAALLPELPGSNRHASLTLKNEG